MKPLFGLIAILVAATAPLSAESARYEQNLLRLAEILGAMHHLQQLCDAYDDQTWRDQMITLMEAEKADEEKEARLTAGFNQGYRKYQERFTGCTNGANIEIDRFTTEGSNLTTWLSRNRR